MLAFLRLRFTLKKEILIFMAFNESISLMFFIYGFWLGMAIMETMAYTALRQNYLSFSGKSSCFRYYSSSGRLSKKSYLSYKSNGKKFRIGTLLL